MKKRKISMAEAAMEKECTFIQSIDISDTITLEELYNLYNIEREENEDV